MPGEPGGRGAVLEHGEPRVDKAAHVVGVDRVGGGRRQFRAQRVDDFSRHGVLRNYLPPRRSAAFSAILVRAALVFPLVHCRNVDPVDTRSSFAPPTRSCGSTTAPSWTPI